MNLKCPKTAFEYRQFISSQVNELTNFLASSHGCSITIFHYMVISKRLLMIGKLPIIDHRSLITIILDYRLIFISSESTSSLVVITLELAWKALWVVISSTNSLARSTLDISKLLGAIEPAPASLGNN